MLVNNAGFGWYGFTDQMPWSLASQMLEVNVYALAQFTMLFLPRMKNRNSGHIINIGSIIGQFPNQGVAMYSGTKAFVDGFTTALYRELRGTSIHVSVIRAGPVVTEFFESASNQMNGHDLPARQLGVKPAAVAERVWALMNQPVRVTYVPRLLALIPWVELSFSWLIDRLGPLLLRRHDS